MTSRRLTIRNAIATNCEGISGIGSVSTESRIFVENVPADAFPALDVIVGQQVYTYNPTGEVDVSLQVLIRGSVLDGETAQTDVENLIAATEDVIADDFTLGGLVIDCKPMTTNTDEGWLEQPAFEMILDVHYVYEHGSADA